MILQTARQRCGRTSAEFPCRQTRSDAMPQFSLRPDTTKYEPRNALSLALASRLAYEEGGVIEGTVRNDWNFPRFHFFSKRETQGFIAGNDQAVLAAFRGTQK